MMHNPVTALSDWVANHWGDTPASRVPYTAVCVHGHECEWTAVATDGPVGQVGAADYTCPDCDAN